MSPLFEILNVTNSTIIVVGKSYYSIDDYIFELETELSKRQFRGEIIFDLLLANGLNAKNRFILSYYYGNKIEDFYILNAKNLKTEYRKYINNYYCSNLKLLDNGILHHKDIEILKQELLSSSYIFLTHG